MPKEKRDSRFSSRFLLGVLLGVALQSNNILVGREGGVAAGARSSRRLPEAQCKDPKFLLKVRGVI